VNVNSAKRAIIPGNQRLNAAGTVVATLIKMENITIG
jgi:hypothetical protein